MKEINKKKNFLTNCTKDGNKQTNVRLQVNGYK